MEKYTANTRFCIIANYTHKLSPALLSRCTRFRFSPLKEPDIRSLVDHVIENENIKIQEEATVSLVRLSKGDMRRALNVLQACHASSTSLTHATSSHPFSLAFSSLKQITSSRHPSAAEKPTPADRIRHQPLHHHQHHHLRLHRRPAPLRHRPHHRHPPPKPRHHVLPQHRQHPQIRQRSCPGGYPDRGEREFGETGGPASDEGRVAGWASGGGVSAEWGWGRDGADGGVGGCCKEWGGFDGTWWDEVIDCWFYGNHRYIG